MLTAITSSTMFLKQQGSSTPGSARSPGGVNSLRRRRFAVAAAPKPSGVQVRPIMSGGREEDRGNRTRLCTRTRLLPQEIRAKGGRPPRLVCGRCKFIAVDPAREPRLVSRRAPIGLVVGPFTQEGLDDAFRFPVCPGV